MHRGWGVCGTGSSKGYVHSVGNVADEARLEKIDKLRKAIAEKTYHVSATDLAGKITDYMLQS